MRFVLFSLLLVLASCTPADSNTLDDAAAPLEKTWTLYPKSDGKPYFHSHAGNSFLSDLTIGRISIKGDSVSQRAVFEGGITLRIFREGVLFLEMNAKRALCLPPWDEVDFLGMTGFSLDSTEVELENMVWKAGEPLVSTPGFVQVIGQDKLIEGRGMEARIDFGYYKIDQVTSVIDLGDGG